MSEHGPDHLAAEWKQRAEKAEERARVFAEWIIEDGWTCGACGYGVIGQRMDCKYCEEGEHPLKAELLEMYPPGHAIWEGYS